MPPTSTWIDGALDQVADQAFELRAREFDIEVFRACRVRRDERQVDFVRRGRRQLFLGFLCFFFEALKRELVGFQIDALLFLELVGQEIHDAKVKIFTAEECVTIG